METKADNPHNSLSAFLLPNFVVGLMFSLSLNFTAQAQDIPKRGPSPEILGGPIHAQDLERLLNRDMRDAFSGQTMRGVYKRPRERSGTQFFTETFKNDGTTEYREGAVKDEGRWMTTKDHLCFDYSGPLAGYVSCFAVYSIGNCYYSYAPESLFNGKPLYPNRWSVKSKLEGDLASCEDLTS